MGRTLKILAIAILVLVLVPAVSYGIYLGTGRSAWLAWKSEREAMGDRFEWAVLLPPPVADEDNFALAPIVAGAIKGKNLDPRFQALKLPKVDRKIEGNWREGRRADLGGYAKAIGTTDILKALELSGPALAELELATKRNGCRIPVDYEAGEQEGLLGFREATRVLRLRALVHLSRGETAEALADVKTSFRIVHQLRSEPSLIAALLRAGIITIVLQPVWEGLADHRWTHSQLIELQHTIAGADLLSQFQLASRAERLHMQQALLSLVEEHSGPIVYREQDREFLEKIRSSRQVLPILWRGWIFRNVLELSRYRTAEWIDVFPRGKHQAVPLPGTIHGRWQRFDRRHKDLILARIAVPALLDQPQRFAFLQASLTHALISCAAERHRLERGFLPESLRDLVPGYLEAVPSDLVIGAPLHYARTPDGAFKLYSTGWDGKDQGGALAWTKENPPNLDPGNGDWPWFATAK